MAASRLELIVNQIGLLSPDGLVKLIREGFAQHAAQKTRL